ncbi:MAG: beta-ketoacyl-ACP synthase III [candidate division Zixibacteria bacterium]
MTNAEFEDIVDTSDEWITSRTGIKERRIASDEMQPSDMAATACRQAMDMAGVANEEIDMLILGTVTPDFRLPATACVTQEKLGLPNAAAFDITAACCGFLSGMSVGRSLIENGTAEKILVTGVEKLSTIVNFKDRGTCVLFGDGAGAVVLGSSDNGRGVLSTFLRSDGSMVKMLWMPSGGTVAPYSADFAYDGTDKITMAGTDIFKVAVREMLNACNRVLDEAGLTADDVSLVVPHQANIRIIEAISKRLGVGLDRFFLNIEKYGNTSAASVPLALDEANRSGRIKDGDYVLMTAFGGGLIWGAAVVQW